MAYSFNVLLDDRTFIQVGSDEMSRCPDKLYATGMSLVIGLCSFETRQEAVVDVYAPARQKDREVIRQNLHVPSKYHQISLTLSHNLLDLCFLRRLSFCGNR
ncbi:hypothetical protein SAMN03159391_03340 [Pseudomonas sp. NFACC37-1]|nr:hypothetical protein SAMN03159391_03340 [Pseudomonas sp. NFACC37-1]SFO47326.1 hypothetical protein SAMN03159304_03494 [Pseudomonas sp. NFACC24-1]